MYFLRLRLLKIAELNASTTSTVLPLTGPPSGLPEDSAGSLDIGLLGVNTDLEYIVTLSADVVGSLCTFGGIICVITRHTECERSYGSYGGCSANGRKGTQFLHLQLLRSSVPTPQIS